MSHSLPLLITTGEPAGVGPELAVRALLAWESEQTAARAPLKLVGDFDLLAQEANKLGFVLRADQVLHTPLQAPASYGQLNPANAAYVLSTLDIAIDAVCANRAAAMVTCPVHKGVINQAGIPFTGHTEYLAQATDTEQVVMLLADTAQGGLKVALATTHIPLAAVPAAITRASLASILGIIHHDFKRWFKPAGLAKAESLSWKPNIWVTGLNPHAGESGHLGHEEIDTIAPAIATAQALGLWVSGPYPADTLFCRHDIASADVVLAMFHDQGLPVLKHASFGRAVNVTLGLPFIRTSVDHGTALDLAGTGSADLGSLMAAIRLAAAMITKTAAIDSRA